MSNHIMDHEIFPDKDFNVLSKFDILLFSVKIEVFIVPLDTDLFSPADLAVCDWQKTRIFIRNTNPQLMRLALWHELIHMGLYMLGHESLWKKEVLVQGLALLIVFMLDANPHMIEILENWDSIENNHID